MHWNRSRREACLQPLRKGDGGVHHVYTPTSSYAFSDFVLSWLPYNTPRHRVWPLLQRSQTEIKDTKHPEVAVNNNSLPHSLKMHLKHPLWIKTRFFELFRFRSPGKKLGTINPRSPLAIQKTSTCSSRLIWLKVLVRIEVRWLLGTWPRGRMQSNAKLQAV